MPNAPMDSRAWRLRSLALGEKAKKSAKLIKNQGMMAFRLSLLTFWTNQVPHIAPKRVMTIGVLSWLIGNKPFRQKFTLAVAVPKHP